MIALFWLATGAAVGFVAAQRKGWNPAAGALGGAVLGFLSPLLFAASGSGGEKNSAPPRILVILGVVVLAAFAIVLLGLLLG